MAYKLYEEASVKDIADAIREKNGSTSLYKISEMGNEVRKIFTGVDTSDADAKSEDVVYGKTAYAEGKKFVGSMRYLKYTGELKETILGLGEYIVLAQDSFLAEIRNEPYLFVRVKFDVDLIPYTVVENWAFNSVEMFPYASNSIYQYTKRYGNGGEETTSTITVPLNTVNPISVGCLQITEDGRLCCYSNSISNYAIRPSKFWVEVRW